MEAVDQSRPNESRHLADEVRELDLPAAAALTWQQLEHIASNYSARTLVKRPGVRVVLMVMEDGAEIPPHSAAGDLTVQVLSGKIAFRVGAEDFMLGRGRMLSVAGGLLHDLVALEDSEVLLTLSNVTG